VLTRSLRKTYSPPGAPVALAERRGPRPGFGLVCVPVGIVGAHERPYARGAHHAGRWEALAVGRLPQYYCRLARNACLALAVGLGCLTLVPDGGASSRRTKDAPRVVLTRVRKIRLVDKKGALDC
jgi:hypothetical protein